LQRKKRKVALAPFFDRVYGAVAGHLAISRDSLNTLLSDLTVALHCGDELTDNDLLIAEFSINLLSRLYPRVSIRAPEPFQTTLIELASRINPDIEFTEGTREATTICVGNTRGGSLFPGVRGWTACLNHSSPVPAGARNPYAAVAAASLSSAELFRRIFLNTQPERDYSFSLLDFTADGGSESELPSVDVEETAFVGVGAVANSAVWAISKHQELTGKLWLVDPEAVTLLNLQRYVLAGPQEIGQAKVALGQETLVESRLNVNVSPTSLYDFLDTRGDLKLPTIVVSVDNVDARRASQASLPHLVINGWTGDQALGSSWHVFRKNQACLACLYHPHGQGLSATEQAARALGLAHERAAFLWVTREGLTDEDLALAASSLGVNRSDLLPWRGKALGDFYTDIVCGAAPIAVKGASRIETVPLAHQSALAGTLMAAEWIKRSDPDTDAVSQREPLVSWENVLQPPPGIWTKPRAREQGCICGDADYQNVYERKWRPSEISVPS
jgi:hypothetical protein